MTRDSRTPHNEERVEDERRLPSAGGGDRRDRVVRVLVARLLVPSVVAAGRDPAKLARLRARCDATAIEVDTRDPDAVGKLGTDVIGIAPGHREFSGFVSPDDVQRRRITLGSGFVASARNLLIYQ